MRNTDVFLNMIPLNIYRWKKPTFYEQYVWYVEPFSEVEQENELSLLRPNTRENPTANEEACLHLRTLKTL